MPRFRRKVLTNKTKIIEGLPELFEKLNDLAVKLDSDEVAKDVLLLAALPIRDEMKDLVPYDPHSKHPPAWPHARDAIFATVGDPQKDPRGPSALVGGNAHRAPQLFWLEFGTTKMPPQPWARPAVAATRAIAARIVAEGVAKKIDEVAKR